MSTSSIIKSQEAVIYIKRNAKKIVAKYANLEKYSSVANPLALFMAGCPGAGKTEYARGLKRLLEAKNDEHIIHIDADVIKEKIPGYTGANSEDLQGASSLGVQKILDHAFHHKQNFILDGRFSQKKLAYKNIERALRHGFQIAIFYIYQDPMVAWDFTKKREALKKRVVPKKVFVEGLLNSIDCVDLIKAKYGKKVEIYVVIKDISNKGIKKTYFNVDRVANYVKIKYNKISLLRKLE